MKCLKKIILKLEAWERLLKGHPDKINGSQTTSSGASREGSGLGSMGILGTSGLDRMRNMISAAEHTAVVAKYLDGERSQKRVALAGTPERAKALGAHSESFPKE